MAESIAIAGVVVAIIGTTVSVAENEQAQRQAKKQSNRANELNQRAQRLEQKRQDLIVARQRRASAREAQVRRAQIVSSSEVAGAGDSSATAGATGSVTTQVGVNLSFLDRTASLSTQSSALFGQAQEIANRPVFAGQIGSTLSAVGGAASSLGIAFSKTPKTKASVT